MIADSITTKIVGAHFRPPAKALLACLPAAHPLFLRPEPQNEYDENAVQVLLRSTTLLPMLEDPFVKDELIGQLAGQGFDLDSVLTEPEWPLGYLPRAAKGNAELEAWNLRVQQVIHQVCSTVSFMNDEVPVVDASLAFDAAGKPAISIPWPPAPTTTST
jgi:hypothetical protein